MAFDLDHYKRTAGQLDLDGLDFDAFRDEPLAPDHLRIIRYMHDVEMHTSCYLRNLLNTRAHHDPDISTFLTMWNFEEYWHGEALGGVLAAHGEPAGEARVASVRERLGWRITTSPLVWMALSGATKHFVAVHMTFGAVNEWTTQGAYARLAQEAGHSTLSDLFRRIMKQEGRHIDYYKTRAEEHLAPARAQKVARRMINTMWKPVGAGVMPAEETAHVIRTLFTGPKGQPVADRIDRRIHRLPGLDGLDLMARAQRRYVLDQPQTTAAISSRRALAA